MKKRRRVKKKVYFALAFIIILIIIIKAIVGHVAYINSYEYKLTKVGYNENEIEVLIKLKDKEIDNILDRKYNAKIVSFAKQKYFIFKNLDRYLSYQKENKSEKMKNIVSLVNVKADYEWYDEDAIIETDTSKNESMLVNKFTYLSESYVPEDLEEISSTYAYEGNIATKEVIKAFKNMFAAAKKDDLTLIVGSSYRSYKDQEEVWDSYATKGEDYADSYAARAGYSEHQTGLSLDIVTYNSTMENYDESDEAKWLKENAYKYGFILRYPKGKENLTGYDYEPWHFRYVGKDVAKKIYEEDITFDEYYAYYIDNH